MEGYISQAYKQAINVLNTCIRPVGFYASCKPRGYEAVWARDSMISALGSSLAGLDFKKTFADSLTTLSKDQSKRGQIPNAVGSFNVERQSKVTYNSIDSTLWYLIGQSVYASAYDDKSLLSRYRKNIDSALTWLEYQDPNEDGLLVQQPTMDWQDAFPHKYGRTINTQALYYAALKMTDKTARANHLQRMVNGETEKYLSLFDKKRGYYLPWIWKTHDIGREEGYWFDTLGNLLAIVTGLATSAIAKKIIQYIEKEKINRPYPCKAIWPPIKKGDSDWHFYFAASDAREPYQYSNAGIWPFIGGFYIAALVKNKQFSKAKKELLLLAEANKQGFKRSDWGFHEWLHGKTGKPEGQSSPYQTWSAGMFLFAYYCVVNKRVPYF